MTQEVKQETMTIDGKEYNTSDLPMDIRNSIVAKMEMQSSKVRHIVELEKIEVLTNHYNEKIKKGLSKDKKVMQALRLANENTAPNHDGKAAPHGSGYKEVDEGKKQYGQKLTDNFFKSVRKFEQEVIVLGKMATKIRGDRTDEKIILKM